MDAIKASGFIFLDVGHGIRAAFVLLLYDATNSRGIGAWGHLQHRRAQEPLRWRGQNKICSQNDKDQQDNDWSRLPEADVADGTECQRSEETKREVSKGKRNDSEHLIRDVRHEGNEADKQYEGDENPQFHARRVRGCGGDGFMIWGCFDAVSVSYGNDGEDDTNGKRKNERIREKMERVHKKDGVLLW